MALDLKSLDNQLGINNSQMDLRHEFELGIDRILKKDFDPINVESVLHQAIQSLEAAQNCKNELSQRNAFKKFIGIFSGGNNKLRDFTVQHLLEAQRATYVLIDKLAENDMILADAIMVNQQAIKRLQLDLIIQAEIFAESLWKINTRFDKIEKELLDHRYKINLLEFHSELRSYIDQQKVESDFQTPKNSLARIFELTSEYFQIVESSLSRYTQQDPKNQYRWSRNVILQYKMLLTEFSGLGKTGEAGSYTWEEYNLSKFVDLLYSSSDMLFASKFFEHLKIQYPISYFPGATSSARVIYLAFKGIRSGINSHDLSESIVRELNLPQDYTINLLSFGTELLSQMKLNASEEYLLNGLNYVLKEIEIENLDQIYNNRNELFTEVGRSHIADFVLTEIFSGRYYEVVRGNCSIHFHIQYATNTSGEFEKFRLIYEFINYEQFFSKNEIIDIAQRNQLSSIFSERNGQSVCEIMSELIPDWLSWQNQKSEIVRFIERLTNDLNKR